MRASWGILVVGSTVALAGCGGTMPGLSPMGNSVTDGMNSASRPQTAQAKQIVQRSPWDITALRSHAPKPKFALERTETVGNKTLRIRGVTFEAEPASGSMLSLSGTLVTPGRTDGNRQHLPALVLIGDRAAGAPQEQARAWAQRGYAALALGLPSKGAGGEKADTSGPDWTDEALANASPTTNPLYPSVVAVIAAVSVLTAQPEVDTRRIGLIGTGWGGVVASLAGAVDDRPHALIVAHAAGGLNRGPLAEALKKLSAKDRDSWTKDYDPDSYAKATHPATLFVQPLAAADPPLSAVIASFRNQTGTKNLALIPADAKDGEATTEATWLASRLQGEAPLPEIRSLRPDGDGALVQISGKLPPRTVAVYYTAGDLARADWKSVDGEKADDRDWHCALPKPEEGKPLTVFAALTDARGAIVCSEPGPLTSSEHPARGRAIAARPSR
jgi:dienelactone hydrolase